MPSESWPLERIGQCCAASFLGFGLVRLLLEKLLVPTLWPKFNTLESRVQKDFCVRCTSVVVRCAPVAPHPLLAISSHAHEQPSGFAAAPVTSVLVVRRAA